MAEAPLSPQQAAQALADIAGYEEGLSARVGGLTGMVWGLVSAAIFVTYGTAPDLPMWLMPFLWVPWTAVGIAITTAAWRLHAITLRPHGVKGGRSWVWSVGFTAFFLVALLGMHFLPMGNSAFPYMVVVNGLAAFVIVVAISRRRGRFTGLPVLVAGVLMVAGAFALAAAHLDTLAMAFASAALVGACFVGSGLVAFVRG
jgi:hypothetical protein